MLFDFTALDASNNVLCEEIPSTAHLNLKEENYSDEVASTIDVSVEIRTKGTRSTNIDFLHLERKVHYEVAAGQRGWLDLCVSTDGTRNDGTNGFSYNINARSEPGR